MLASMTRALISFVCGPKLPVEVRHTYLRHLCFSLLDAVSSGVLANAPLMAVKGMAAQDWHLTLPLILSSLGMVVTLWSGNWMACRAKKPFVLLPWLVYAFASLSMALAQDGFWFLGLLGLGALFEVTTRPALTAIIRQNYSVAHRGKAVGEIRKWCSIVFMLATAGSAASLQWASDPGLMIRIQVVAAGGLSLLGCLCFYSIRVREATEPTENPRAGLADGLLRSMRIVREDCRFRRYLMGCFLFGFSGLLYLSFIPSFLAHDLGFSYIECAMLIHVLPSLASFLCTGYLCGWFDRTNPLVGWAVVRAGWGLDAVLLAAVPALLLQVPVGAFLLCAAGRVLRGSVMGGSFVLWWQIGTNYFTPPGHNTARYMSILTSLNGVMRLLAPLAGVFLLSFLNRPAVLLIGGLGVLLSALHSWAQWNDDQAGVGFRVFADAEQASGLPIGGLHAPLVCRPPA
jgi:MFS family permease